MEFKMNLMKKVFFIHAIIEMIGGIVVLFKPTWLLMSDGQVLDTIIVAKLYGLLALTFGALTFMLSRIFEYTDTFKKIGLILMFFHLMVSFQMYAAYNQGSVSNLGPFGLHMILAILFFGAHMMELNKYPMTKEVNEFK